MAKRVLVTGASGLLGRAIYKEFLSYTSWETLGLAFSRAKGNLKKLDITDESQVKEVINTFKVCFLISVLLSFKNLTYQHTSLKV
jgi:S-adenosylmethionine synthetase